jgi:hypothetical protein
MTRVNPVGGVGIYFSDFFEINKATLEAYGLLTCPWSMTLIRSTPAWGQEQTSMACFTIAASIRAWSAPLPQLRVRS